MSAHTIVCARCDRESGQTLAALRPQLWDLDAEWIDGSALTPPHVGVLCRKCAVLFGANAAALDLDASWR